MEDDDIYENAKKKVEAKKGFFYHLAAYVLILVMLYAIMYFENEGTVLPVIVVGLSWGIGLVAHYLTVFGTENLEIFGVNADWEEEELEKELERLKRKRQLKDQITEEKSLLDQSEILELKEIEKRRLDRDGYA